MAKFIKSKFKVLWGTVFAFFYGFFASDVIAQEDDTGSEEVTEEVEEKSADGKEASEEEIQKNLDIIRDKYSESNAISRVQTFLGKFGATSQDILSMFNAKDSQALTSSVMESIIEREAKIEFVKQNTKKISYG